MSQTIAASGYYGIEVPLLYIHNLKTQSFFFLVAGVLEVKFNHIATVVLYVTKLGRLPHH